jgi:hypothetical protein
MVKEYLRELYMPAIRSSLEKKSPPIIKE